MNIEEKAQLYNLAWKIGKRIINENELNIKAGVTDEDFEIWEVRKIGTNEITEFLEILKPVEMLLK